MGDWPNRSAGRCGIGVTPGAVGEARGGGPPGAQEAGVEGVEGEEDGDSKMPSYRLKIDLKLIYHVSLVCSRNDYHMSVGVTFSKFPFPISIIHLPYSLES